MPRTELTNRACAAKLGAMLEERRQMRTVGPGAIAALAVLASLGVGGCVSVNAPDKPIVIELNINIKQEVIYRLSEDAKNTIESNPEIF
ncbi:MAG: YnbE family lipoprotein [Novosphingobium sp.]